MSCLFPRRNAELDMQLFSPCILDFKLLNVLTRAKLTMHYPLMCGQKTSNTEISFLLAGLGLEKAATLSCGSIAHSRFPAKHKLPGSPFIALEQQGWQRPGQPLGEPHKSYRNKLYHPDNILPRWTAPTGSATCTPLMCKISSDVAQLHSLGSDCCENSNTGGGKHSQALLGAVPCTYLSALVWELDLSSGLCTWSLHNFQDLKFLCCTHWNAFLLLTTKLHSSWRKKGEKDKHKSYNLRYYLNFSMTM